MPPEREKLSRDRIVHAAIEMMDESGLAALSMERLGRSLGVTDMALYKHVSSKDELLSLMLDALVSRLPATPTGDLEDSLRGFALGIWSVIRTHPEVLPLLAAKPLGSPAIRAAAGQAQAQLTAAGWDGPTASGALFALAAYTLGAAGLVTGGTLAIAAELTDGAPAESVERRPPKAAIDWERADIGFGFGLEALLTGLRAQLG
jgi:TetR/AcrR family transcriptional regulator, tetracycline repressor protein